MCNAAGGRFGGRLTLSVLAGIIVLAATALQAQEAKQEEKFEWVPAAAQNADQVVERDARHLDIVITETPKPTASIDKFTKVYVIDLAKFNISNEGKNAVETTKGINAALQDAKTTGANRIVFPRGTYLIHAADAIVLDHKDTIIDLNGSTLQMEPNGMPKCRMVDISYGAENLRLTNGILRGEKDQHDFVTTKGSHEWVDLLDITSGRNIEVDHLLLTNSTGTGVTTKSGITGEGSKQRYHYLYTRNMEHGGFSDTGEKVVNAEKIRTMKPYDISVAKGQFEFGYTAGYMGFPYIKGRAYQAYFYAEDMTFIAKRECLQYKKGPVPEGAKWIHLEFNQSEIRGVGDDGTIKDPYCGFISNFRSPVDVHFHDNQMIRNRQLGMAYCGGQRWIIENNLFEENGPASPGFGVDFEDGWLMMQDVVFRNNKFKNNIKGDLVVCAGSELRFEGNEIEKGAYFWDATLSYTFRNNVIMGGDVAFKTRTGHVTAQDNHYENCTLLIRFDPRGFNNGFYRKPGEVLQTPPVQLERETLVNVKAVNGTYFDFVDSTLKNVPFFAGEETKLVRFKNCEFDNASVNYSDKGPEVQVTIEDCKGTLLQKGAGLNRAKATP